MTPYYKVLNEDRTSCNGGHGRWTPGRWRSVRGPLVPCQHGLHVCTRDQLINWLGPAIWEAEVDGETVDAGDKTVARRARIVRRLDNWNETTARLVMADWAEHVLPLAEADARETLECVIYTVRAYVLGGATQDELDAARDAAWMAAGGAAKDINWDATWAAARASERKWQTERLWQYLNGLVTP